MEIWDGYKKDGSLADCNLFRDEPFSDGLYHIVCEVLVKHVDGTYLLMQRDFNKDSFPGMFEAGASGSKLKGETPLESAIRELKEETGIESNDLALVYVQSNMKHLFHYGYLCITNCGKDSIVLQKGETIGYKWLPRDEFINYIINSQDFVAPQKDRWLPFLSKI